MQSASTSDNGTIAVRAREEISLTGVEEVLRFDEASVLCRTTLGDLAIEGSSLRITDFSSERGSLCVKGSIVGMYYEEKREKSLRRILGRRKRE